MRSFGIVIAPPVLDDLPRLAVAGKEVLVQALITQDLAEIEVAGYAIKSTGSSDSTEKVVLFGFHSMAKYSRRVGVPCSAAKTAEQHTQLDTELALLADPGSAARPDRSGLHPPGNRTGTAALSRVPLTYIVQLVILAGDDPRLSRQKDAGVRRRTVGQGVPEFREPSGETAGHPERRAFARYPAVLAGKPPRSARGRQDGPVLHSHQPAVETVFRVAGRPGGTGQR